MYITRESNYLDLSHTGLTAFALVGFRTIAISFDPLSRLSDDLIPRHLVMLPLFLLAGVQPS